jgi:hypothetical protein
MMIMGCCAIPLLLAGCYPVFASLFVQSEGRNTKQAAAKNSFNAFSVSKNRMILNFPFSTYY